ncbi:hypothetical protein RclHR1_00810007 [Rhizophagus clarus]|uniref:Protein kinase domain-containing protein n=1 Tax=Rhizophagus clarus TaxID=94130 RepID=A0A2Z6SB17_9GLOM|nr:hypothetical protein RclHR1_00810007 [Rhizophagus clarus]
MELLTNYCVDLTKGKEIIAKNFSNWTSGNTIIDNFIQDKQINFDGYGTIFEWIPYNGLINIKERRNNCFATAIWKDGPLCNIENEWRRSSYEKVTLRFLYDMQNITDEFLNKVGSYLLPEIFKGGNFGITQNPDTKVYILVFTEWYFENFCEKCGNKYKDDFNKWCKPCQTNQFKNNFTKWTSGNTIIDNFIQDKQINFDGNGTVFEWIPYNDLIEIKEIEGCDRFGTAIWRDGPLRYDKKFIRNSSYDKVALIILYDLQNITDGFLNKVESYLLDEYYNYGMTQNPDTKFYILVFNVLYFEYYCKKCGNKYDNEYNKWCRQCQINHLKNNFTNLATSGDERIDDFIQKIQLKISECNDLVFEWIPYNELIETEEIDEDGFAIAIWKEGPLQYQKDFEEKLKRKPYYKVVLRFLHDLQNVTDEFLNKVESYFVKKLVFGISQNPNSKVYILIFNNYSIYCVKCGNKYESDEYTNENDKWCKACQLNHLKRNFANWTSNNEKIDNFIQKCQSKINKHSDTIFEWIPYNKFTNINEIRKSDFAIATWEDGPLCYSYSNRKYKRKLNEAVLLKYLYNSQHIDNTFLNKITYSMEGSYGISQNPNTKDFIFVLQQKYYCENCGNKYDNRFEMDNKNCILCQTNHENPKISVLLQEMRLYVNQNSSEFNMIFEWIPYDQFDNIEEIGKGGFSTVYSAIWKDGLLNFNKYSSYWSREQNTKVALKCLHNSQNFLDEFINEVRAYPHQKIENILKIYGISQNPYTKDYIMVLEYAEDGNFNSYLNKNCENFDWFNGLKILINIIEGLCKIHQKHMVHRDFHIGNILFTKITKYINEKYEVHDSACISDLGLCRKIDDINEKNIYGVMPYVAPEVLKGKPYTQAADIYSFGMIMYVIATGKQPFANYAHDEVLALSICKGNKPEINDKIAPKCYIDLMNRCWGSNPDNRPNSIEIRELIYSFYNSLDQSFKEKEQQHYEIEEQFNETQEYRKESLLSIKNSQLTTHTQAVYSSRLLNSFTKNLSKYDDNINNTVEITDFTNL